MASFKLIRPKDVVENTGGMLLPSQINRLNAAGTAAFSSSGWTTGLTTERNQDYAASTGLQVPAGYYKIIPSYAAVSTSYVCYGINSNCLNGYNYCGIPMSATSGDYTYAAFPKSKLIRIRIYEDLLGSVNFEYFYIKYGSTKLYSKTWKDISGNWTGSTYIDLNKSYTNDYFLINCGGMNSARRIYYSDNVVSPGAWSYLGAYNNLNIQPGINAVKKTWIQSGVTRQISDSSLTANTTMNFIEYLYRLKDISIGVGYSSTPPSSYASSSSYATAWSYDSKCNYSCSCDCDYCPADYTTT
jgi:hypothetical protein